MRPTTSESCSTCGAPLAANRVCPGCLLGLGLDDAPVPDGESPFVATPSHVGPYRLLEPLGRGGMGEIFRAEATRHGRTVALKLLPEALTCDPERIDRFRREARAASALNHPNIVTIYDFGEQDGRHYIASELVEGRTLRELVRGGPLALPQALDIAAQIAGALAAAHEAGIVHRDIKPENVMLRADGYVKVLDFGVAKLISQPEPDDAGDEVGAVTSAFDTRAGTVLGTVSYMSPEQARGGPVDARSDLFSLGIVLHEMVTGQAPFGGPTPERVQSAILHDEPTPLAATTSAASPAVRRLLLRALAKDPSQRFASARELLDEIRSLQRAIEAGWFGRHWLALTAAAVGLAVVVVAAVLAALGQLAADPSASPVTVDRMKTTRLTTTGDVVFGTISPDGGSIAYVEQVAEGFGFWVRPIEGGSPRAIMPPGRISYWWFTFAPDGRSIYFVAEEREHRVGGVLYRASAAGGSPTRLTVGVQSVAVSPDGTRLLLRRHRDAPRTDVLTLADADGRNEEEFTTLGENRSVVQATWSPDGAAISWVFADRDAAGEYWGIAEKRFGGGAAHTIVTRRDSAISALAWLPDGSGLVVNADDKSSGARQLWHVSHPGGAWTRITRDLSDYGAPILTADGRTILTVESSRPARIWGGPFGDPERAVPVTMGQGRYGELAFTPDGRLVHVVAANGESNLWIMDADGSKATQLTSGARENVMPDVSPDGRTIVFVSTRTGDLRLWRMDIDGGNPRQLGTDGGWNPQFSRDGRWIVYQHGVDGKSALWKIPAAGGAPVRLVEQDAAHPTLSPDGAWIAYEEFDERLRRTRLVVRPAEGAGSPRATFEQEVGYDTLRWSADGRALVFANGRDSSELLVQPIAGGPPSKAVAGHETIFAFALSPDGSRVAYTSGYVTADLVVFRDFR